MINKDIVKVVGFASSLIGFGLLLVYLKKKGVFSSDIRKWTYRNPIQNESQEWKYFNTLNKDGMSKFKRSLNPDFLVNL